MTAREDYPSIEGDPYAVHCSPFAQARAKQRQAMCDEIDRLRAEVERDRPVIEAARAVVDEWRIRGDHGCSVAIQDRLRAALAACAPDEVNEAEAEQARRDALRVKYAAIHVVGPSAPDEVNEAET